MKAIQIVKPGEIKLIEMEKPEITGQDHVLIKMTACDTSKTWRPGNCRPGGKLRTLLCMQNRPWKCVCRSAGTRGTY